MKFKIKFKGIPKGETGKPKTIIKTVEAEWPYEAEDYLRGEFEVDEVIYNNYSQAQVRAKRKKMQEERHREAIMRLLTLTGGSKLKVGTVVARLRSIEYWAHKDAENYCNGIPVHHSDEYYKKQVMDLFNNNLKGFFINGDPRGYALKIDDRVMTNDPDYKNIGLHRDFGGYGILAPEITGE